MSANGPVLLLSPQRTPLSPSSFKVKNHFDSPLRFKALTNLPKDKYLCALGAIDRTLSEKVLNVLTALYSHVVCRNHREGIVTFFHHVASAALFEADCKTLIHDKDHGKKAGGIFNQSRNVLTDLKKHLKDNAQTLSQNERQVLEHYIALFIMHHNILVTTLKNARSEVKNHLMRHANLQIDNLSLLEFSATDRVLVEAMYPQTPPRQQNVPLKDRLTPKAKSKDDIKSVATLQRLKADVGQPMKNGLQTSRSLLNAFSTQRPTPPPSAIPSKPLIKSALTLKK